MRGPDTIALKGIRPLRPMDTIAKIVTSNHEQASAIQLQRKLTPKKQLMCPLASISSDVAILPSIVLDLAVPSALRALLTARLSL